MDDYMSKDPVRYVGLTLMIVLSILFIVGMYFQYIQGVSLKNIMLAQNWFNETITFAILITLGISGFMSICILLQLSSESDDFAIDVIEILLTFSFCVGFVLYIVYRKNEGFLDLTSKNILKIFLVTLVLGYFSNFLQKESKMW